MEANPGQYEPLTKQVSIMINGTLVDYLLPNYSPDVHN